MLHLEGNNRPVLEEVDAVATHVVGAVPPDLVGTFVRNGPNPATGWSPHLYAGDGMVHALTLGAGTPAYRNRWVRTPLLAGEPRTGDPRQSTANTHVVEHAGRLLALEEGGFPYEITRDLDTLGPWRFGGALDGPFTAHPKRCPTTGELFAFGYSPRPPFLRWFRITAGGEMAARGEVDLRACSMQHDFAITATQVVFYDSPLVFDPVALATGNPWRWAAEEHPARIGVMDRAGGPVRWTEVSPGHLSHAANAHDDGAGGIVLAGTRLPDPTGLPTLHEWRIDAAGRVSETPLDDVVCEYPRLHDDRTGLPHAALYTSGFFYEAEPHHGEVHKHTATGRLTHRLPAGQTCGEPVFVPREGSADEDDGWLLTFVHDRATDRSHLLVLHAEALEPVAEVHLPVRVPGGFHGSWLRA